MSVAGSPPPPWHRVGPLGPGGTGGGTAGCSRGGFGGSGCQRGCGVGMGFVRVMGCRMLGSGVGLARSLPRVPPFPCMDWEWDGFGSLFSVPVQPGLTAGLRGVAWGCADPKSPQ